MKTKIVKLPEENHWLVGDDLNPNDVMVLAERADEVFGVTRIPVADRTPFPRQPALPYPLDRVVYLGAYGPTVETMMRVLKIVEAHDEHVLRRKHALKEGTIKLTHRSSLRSVFRQMEEFGLTVITIGVQSSDADIMEMATELDIDPEDLRSQVGQFTFVFARTPSTIEFFDRQLHQALQADDAVN